MRILPLTNQPPWSYDASEVLKPPKSRPLSFEEIVKRVRRFRSDSVVLMGSRLLWHFWANPSLVDPNVPGGMENHITQTYSERIISLACVYGSAYNRPAVSEVEFRLLCWELSWGTGEGFFTEKMVDCLRDRLGRVAKDSPLRHLSPDMARWLLAAAFRAHAVAEQHLGRTWDGHSLPRAILLAREYRKLALRHGGFDFERRERAFLLAEPDELARAHWMLLAMAAKGGTVEVHGPKGFERIHEHGATLLERERWVGDKSAYALRGEAFANYLRAALANVPGMFDLDDFKSELPDGKRPDFAWVGEEYGILVEAKFSLKPNTSRNLADVSAIVETWERAAEPVAQAGEFLARGLPRLKGKLPTPKKWVLVVVANEPFIEDGLGFKLVAKAGGLLSGTGLDGIAMFTPTDLESWALGGTPDELGERVRRVYELLDPTAIEPQLDVGKPECGGPQTPPHLARVWAELFPGGAGPA